MKKSLYLVVILALVLAIGLVAVGCGDEEEAPATTAAPTETTAAPTETTAAPTETTAAPTETTAAAEPIKLQTATSNAEGTANADAIQFFMDYVADKSGGAIQMECYFGGSFCGDPEVPEYLKQGELDFSIVQCVYTMTSFPLGFSLCGYESMQGTMDILTEILNDPEIGPMIQAQAAENNWYLVDYTAAGRSLLLSKTEIKSWEDAAAQKLTIGSPINLDIYASLGLNTTAVEPPDMYEALSRGIADLVAFSGAGIQSQKLTECANHIGDMRSFFTNQNIMFNLDVWNSFTDEQKALMAEAAKATSDFTVQQCEDLEAVLKDDVVNNLGGTWNEFTDEEGKTLNAKFMAATVGMLNSFADNLGQREQQDKLTAAWAEALGQTF